MNRSVKSFLLEALNFDLSGLRILEVGSRQMLGQENWSNLRPFLNCKEFIGMDYIDGPGVDIVMDVHQMNFMDKFDIVICAEVIEHVLNPFVAIEQIHGVLKSDGILLLTAPMKLEIHGSPYDYWRYTPQGFDVLLTKYNYKYITFAGSSIFPLTICAVASNTQLNDIIKKNIFNWELKNKKVLKTNKLRNILVFNFVPPIFWGSHYEFWLRGGSKSFISFIKLLIPNVMRLKWKN